MPLLMHDPAYIREWDRRCELVAADGIPKLQLCPRCGYELPDYFLTETDVSVVCSVCKLEVGRQTVEAARRAWNDGARKEIDPHPNR